jgi:hypothetical protein
MTPDELYLSNLKKVYPNITEKELDDMFKEFKLEVEKQDKMEETVRLARRIDAS